LLAFGAVAAVSTLLAGPLTSGAVAPAGSTPEPAPKPVGAVGTEEWYSVALPDGRVSTLGVYRPGKPNGSSVLLFHGKDGPRGLYEDLAQ
jgi:hypothetical protein